MWEAFVEKRSVKVKNRVEYGAVKKFAEAIGDLNPLYYDEELAARSRYGRLIAPPTFPRLFDYGQIEGLVLPASGLIHGEQSFQYRRPLYVGEEVWCDIVLKDVYTRQGKSGELTFLIFERTGSDKEGWLIFTAMETIIVTETVRKGMAQ